MELGQKIGRMWLSVKGELREISRGYIDEELQLNEQVLSGQASPQIVEGFRRYEIHNLTLKLALQPDLSFLGIPNLTADRMKKELDELESGDDLEQTLKDRARKNLEIWRKLPNKK